MAETVVRFENVELRLDDPAISDTERPVINAVSKKLACCAEHKARIGPELYELQTLTKLNVSCEMVGFNVWGHVYLVQRQPLVESPHEPYPDFWHTLGSGLEPYEEWENVFVSVARKFGEHVVLEHITYVNPVGYPPIAHDLPRGPYLLQIFIARIVGIATNPRGRFFNRAEIPWDDLVPSHKNIILPAAFRKYDTKRFSW